MEWMADHHLLLIELRTSRMTLRAHVGISVHGIPLGDMHYLQSWITQNG